MRCRGTLAGPSETPPLSRTHSEAWAKPALRTWRHVHVFFFYIRSIPPYESAWLGVGLASRVEKGGQFAKCYSSTTSDPTS